MEAFLSRRTDGHRVHARRRTRFQYSRQVQSRQGCSGGRGGHCGGRLLQHVDERFRWLLGHPRAA